MAGFIVGALLLVGIVLVPMLWPLLRRPAKNSPTTTNLQAAVYRDQLVELAQDRAAGTLSQADYETAVAEVERRCLEENVTPLAAAPTASTSGRRAALALGLVLPAGAALLYLALGTPDALRETPHAQHFTSGDIEGMVASLEAKLEQAPDNPAGWRMLGRSYKSMGRYREAVRAFERTGPLLESNPDLLVDYADTLVALAGEFTPQAHGLIERALHLAPEHPQALWLRGTAAFDGGDYAAAVADWERLLAGLEPASDDAQAVAANIAEARAQGGLAPGAGRKVGAGGTAPAAVQAFVKGRVELAAEFRGKLPDDAVVMVLARPPDGSRMPLAVLRARIADLPLAFTLDDSLAMAPGHSLSQFAEVEVEARVSLTGSAMPKPGDLFGPSQRVRLGASNVRLKIDQVR